MQPVGKKIRITAISSEKLEKDREKITISTTDGNIQCIYHPAGGDKGIIWLCGALGGFDGPSFGIFKILRKGSCFYSIQSTN
jgi:hypothetical protein